MYGSKQRERMYAEAGLTNQVLDDEEIAIVQQLLVDAETTLRVDTSNAIQGGITKVHRTRCLAEDITRFKIAIAPHKKLPAELLSHIFLLCLEGGLATWPPERNSPPWVLGRVCSRWRRIALDGPQLWASLLLLGSTTPTDEFIARSKGNPLSIILKYPLRTLDLISPHSKRVRSLRIEDTDPLFLQSTLPFYSLESATLEFPSFLNGLWKMASYGKIPVFDNAPKLRRVAFHYKEDHSIPFFSKNQFNLNWAQLTTITFFKIAPPLPSALDIIREAVSLVEFCFVRIQGTFIGFGETGVYSAPHIVHNKLQVLLLGLGETNDLGYFVEKLTLPSLKNFENTGFKIYGPRTTIHPQLLPFFTRSCRSIKTLSLSGEANMPQMKETFGSVPSLVELHLTEGYPISASCFDLMRDGDLLPVLEVLVCETLSVFAFVEFLESRTGGSTRPRIRRADIRGFETSLSTDDIGLAEERFVNLQPMLKVAGGQVSIIIHDGPLSYALGTQGDEGNGVFGFFEP